MWNNMEQLKKYTAQKQTMMAGKKTNITCLQVPHPHGGYIVNNDQYHWTNVKLKTVFLGDDCPQGGAPLSYQLVYNTRKTSSLHLP